MPTVSNHGQPTTRRRETTAGQRERLAAKSNDQARLTWNRQPVGSQRSSHPPGSVEYFADLRTYRYGYETPFIARQFRFAELKGKRVLEIGVGNGIDAVEMARHGAEYAGLDITPRHLALTRRNFELNLPEVQPHLILGDLLTAELTGKFDVIISFGVMHHIAHEDQYYARIRELLHSDGVFRVAVYSKYSLFNAYLLATWLWRNRCRVPLDDWRSHLAEHSHLGSPVTIKIRSRREVASLLRLCGFRITRYDKCGFVQRYLPVVGPRWLHPDGQVLNSLGRLLGWYHFFECRP